MLAQVSYRNLVKMEMGGSVGSAPACYGSSLGSNPDISQKYKMGDISKGVANTKKNLLYYIVLSIIHTCMYSKLSSVQGIVTIFHKFV
jgi:hypothetical protein